MVRIVIYQSHKGAKKEVKVPTVMPEGVDHFATLLTSEGHTEERHTTITWFNTPGWGERGTNRTAHDPHLGSKVDECHYPMHLFPMLFTGYSSCPFGAGVGDNDRFEGTSKGLVKELDIVHEGRSCSLGPEEVPQATGTLVNRARSHSVEVVRS